jgi:hypothetical protein
MLPRAVSPAIERLCNNLPRTVITILAKTAFGMGVLFVVSLVVIEGFILCNMRETAVPNADYVVVRGCQVKGSVPLRRRVDTAVRYVRGNPGARVVVSGGRGAGEENTEAAVMKMLLRDYGIDEARILYGRKSVEHSRKPCAFRPVVPAQRQACCDRYSGRIAPAYGLRNSREAEQVWSEGETSPSVPSP